MKNGKLTLCRIDDVSGGSKMLFFDAMSIEGRDEAGTYMWLSTEKRQQIEYELIRGCHGSRFAAVYSDIIGALRETSRFIKGMECVDLSSERHE